MELRIRNKDRIYASISEADEKMKAGEVPVEMTIAKKIALATGGNIRN